MCIVASALFCGAQRRSPVSPEKLSTGVPSVSLEEMAIVDVPSLAAESYGLPILCSADGTLYLQVASMVGMNGMGDSISISSDGKRVVQFGRDKISDIPRASIGDMFLEGNDLYLLTLTTAPAGHTVEMRTHSGEVQRGESIRAEYFISRFRSDGSYLGSVRLDLPFQPLHLGVFGNGDFLIAGAAAHSEPQQALVSSTGQFQRSIDIKGDIHVQSDSNSSKANKDSIALSELGSGPADTFSGGSLLGSVFGSQIIADGSNLLIIRPGIPRVFTVTPGGEVHAQDLKLPGKYKLDSIKALHDMWIANFTYDRNEKTGWKLAAFAINPTSGEPVKQYTYPDDLGFGIACTDGTEFTFVKANPETKSLQLVKAAVTGPAQ